MDSSVSQKDQFWFLRVCLHVPIQLYVWYGPRGLSERDCGDKTPDFDVLLTVHLSIILVINQLNAQIPVL